MASGSKVQLIIAAQEKLLEEKIDARVVSFPSWELFERQSETYRNEVLPKQITRRLAVEAGSPLGWCRWTRDADAVIGITKFGSSASAEENFKHYGSSVENIVEHVRKLM